MPNPVLKRSRSTAQRNIMELAAKVESMDMPKLWFQKRKRIFRLMDPQDSGLASTEGMEVMAQRFEQHANMGPDEGKEMRNILDSFWMDVLKSRETKMTLDHFNKINYVLFTNPELKDDLDMFVADLLDNMFRVIDTNHDGIISRTEWRTFFKCIDVPEEKLADEAFDTIDLNKDGIMSNDEFVKGAREYVISLEHGQYDLFYGPLPEL